MSGTTIENSGATADTGNRYTICQRSGMKYKPGVLVKEPITNLWVHPNFLDPAHPQLRVRVKAEDLHGSIRPEAKDVFITTAVSPDDL